MPFVYILKSMKDGNLYTGSTIDLYKRIVDHNKGKTPSTKYRRPLKLVYYEQYDSIGEARVREKELKGSTFGKRKKELIDSFPNERLHKYF